MAKLVLGTRTDFAASSVGNLSSELNVTQRDQDKNDRRYDVDGGHGCLPREG